MICRFWIVESANFTKDEKFELASPLFLYSVPIQLFMLQTRESQVYVRSIGRYGELA